MMPEEESEVSFADFGGSKRLRAISAKPPTKTPPRRSGRGHWEQMERETGLGGIGHSSCLSAQRPGMGVMRNP